MTSHWQDIIRAHFALDVSLERLVGEYDENFLARSVSGETFVVKIMRPGCDAGFVEMQIEALNRLYMEAPSLPFPRPVAALDGAFQIDCPDTDGQRRVLWIITALPGKPLSEVSNRPDGFLTDIGRKIAQTSIALSGFEHPQLSRESKWRLQDGAWIASYLDRIGDSRRAELISGILDEFGAIQPTLAGLPKQAVHNDHNDYNILVGASPGEDPKVTGLLDLGDMTLAPRICDLAIAAAYLVLDRPDPARDLATLVAGFHSVLPLSETELALLYPLLRMRLAVSVVNSSIEMAAEPENSYLAVTQAPAWRFLEQQDLDANLVLARLRHTCGFPVTPAADRVRSWLKEARGSFAPVLPGDLRNAPISDLSVQGTTLPENPFSLRPDEAGLLGGVPDNGFPTIGRFGEPRLIYTDKAFYRGEVPSQGRRSVHIGVDVFLPAGTPVSAPFAGTVVAVENNSGHLDYGGLVTLAHETPEGDPFYTLYGHLSAEIVNRVKPGEPVAHGQVFAELGAISENGGWAPHLHFQMALTLDGLGHAWPGVAYPGDAGFMKAIMPNPAALLNLPDEAVAYVPANQDGVAELRKDHFGENLKLSYQKPLMFLRGWKHHLFDEWGQPYLDAYNNVPHVGHAHPRIRAVAADQLGRMNSNTRYLHPAQTAFAEKILSKMPDPLSVCYFVNSGSEANELALRLARAHSGGKDMVVPDHGYHGNTTGAIDLSAYKFNKPGGVGQQDWIQLVDVADDYRGAFRRDDPDRAEKYAALVDDAIENIARRGGRLAGFIAETYPSVGGQIIPPPGYLQAVYKRIRAAGGLCIADEVQTGLGRLGQYYFGFEAQQVVPDIVVLGKPLGNGHPIGAVITRPDIAASFANGIEFFSTFGGSNLSCRIGKEVLDIVDDEALQANAEAMGALLLEGLRGLIPRHESIGDVRGMGLFIGVDLIEDQDTLRPATRLADHVLNRMREERILMGTEGPFDNILKIRPPLTIDAENIRHIVDTLDKVLADVGQ